MLLLLLIDKDLQPSIVLIIFFKFCSCLIILFIFVLDLYLSNIPVSFKLCTEISSLNLGTIL